MKQTKNFLLLATFLLLGTFITRAETLKITEMVPAMAKFRLATCNDPQKAFEEYATDSAATHFKELAKTLSPLAESKTSWMYFFGTSISAVNAISKQTILAIFYNPWSDVALITEWKKQGKNPKITDATLVTGDILRDNKKPVLYPVWLRTDKAPPQLQILLSTGQTIKDFLKLYVDAHESKDAENWRAKLPNLSTEQQIKANDMAVGVLFSQALASIHSFFTEKDYTNVKTKMDQARQLLIQSKIDDFLALAKDTTKESQDILKKIPLDWKLATLIATAKDQKNTFVFLSSFANPEYFACFWFKNGGENWLGQQKEPTLSRVDFLGYNLSFQQLDDLAKKAGVAQK